MKTYYKIMDENSYAKITVYKENYAMFAKFEWPTGAVSTVTVSDELELKYTHQGKKAKVDLYVVNDALRCWKHAGIWEEDDLILGGEFVT